MIQNKKIKDLKDNLAKVLALSLVCPFFASPLYGNTISLNDVGSTQPGFKILGIDDTDRAASSVSGAGDVNGDGLMDVIVGAPLADPDGNSNAGEAYVVFGKTGSTAVDLATLQATGNGFRIDGVFSSARAGASVSGAGDVNGDGLDDLIIGAYEHSEVGRINAGISYVVFGKNDSAPLDFNNLNTNGFAILGDDSDDRSGFEVSGAGDVNGDGFADLLIGAPFADPNLIAQSGECYVVYGKSDTADVDLASLGNQGFRINGISASDFTGDALSGAGDINGDGLDDIVIGVDNIDVAGPFGYDAGEIFVVFGKSDTGTVELSSLGANDGFRITSPGAGEQAGFSVAGAGDINGDGLADLVIGVYRGGTGYNGTGEAYVVFGKTNGNTVDLAAIGNDGFLISGIDSNDRLGTSVSGAGDVNSDGLADILLGARQADLGSDNAVGESYVVFGKNNTDAVALSTLNGSNGFIMTGITANDWSGSSVSGAGDVNGDGHSDIIIGALNVDRGVDSDVGEAYVIFGPGPGVTPGVAGAPAGTITSPSSVVAAGDAAPVAIGGANGTGLNPSRVIIDFADGGVSRVEARALANPTLPSPFTAGNTAPTLWQIETTRSFTNADVTFQYSDLEISGLNEANLRIYSAPTLNGTFVDLGGTVNTSTNEITVTGLTSFSVFLLSDQTGLPVVFDFFEVD